MVKEDSPLANPPVSEAQRLKFAMRYVAAHLKRIRYEPRPEGAAFPRSTTEVEEEVERLHTVLMASYYSPPLAVRLPGKDGVTVFAIGDGRFYDMEGREWQFSGVKEVRWSMVNSLLRFGIFT